jgi:serine/threonine protein kinase
MKAFARKIVRGSNMNAQSVMNETRAIAKLCQPGAHKNIVSVLRHGSLPEGDVFYDMELCAINLRMYITRKWNHPVRNELRHLSSLTQPREKIKMAMYIMFDIAEGVSFIHRHEEVHRDLKPENGAPFVINLNLKDSPIFIRKLLLENQ